MIIEIILVIILIIIILLYLGVDLVGNLSKESSKLTFSFKVLIFKKIKLYIIEYPSKKKEKEEDKKNNSKITLELIKPCIGTFLEFSKYLFKSIDVEKLKIHVDLGLSSYVSTAKYVGYLWAFFVFPNTTLENTSFTATPHFGESIIDLKCIVDVRINLLKLIIPILKLVSNKNVRKLIKVVIK